MPLLHQLNVRCDGDTYLKWNRYADALGMKLSELIRECMDKSEPEVKRRVDSATRRKTISDEKVAEAVNEIMKKLLADEPLLLDRETLYGPRAVAMYTLLATIFDDDEARKKLLDKFLAKK